MPGCITGLPCSYGENLDLQIRGNLKFETIEFDHVSSGTRTRERLRWRGPATTVNYKPALSSERASHKALCYNPEGHGFETR
jgi:hypothetical protein